MLRTDSWQEKNRLRSSSHHCPHLAPSPPYPYVLTPPGPQYPTPAPPRPTLPKRKSPPSEVRSGKINPTHPLCFTLKLRAASLGQYPNRFASACTRALVATPNIRRIPQRFRYRHDRKPNPSAKSRNRTFTPPQDPLPNLLRTPPGSSPP